MQPRNLAVVDAGAVLDALVVAGALAELDVAVLAAGVLAAGVLLTLDELLPQAASSRVAAPATAAVINAVCFTVSSQWIRLPVPGHDGAPRSPDCPENISPVCPMGRGTPDCGRVVAQSRPKTSELTGNLAAGLIFDVAGEDDAA
jgi:hypothetical protein